MSFEKDLKLCEETIIDRFLSGSFEEDLNKQDNIWYTEENNDKIKWSGEQCGFANHFTSDRKEILRKKVAKLKEDLINVSNIYLADADTLQPTERALLKVVKTVANYDFNDSGFLQKFCPSFTSNSSPSGNKVAIPEEYKKSSEGVALHSTQSDNSFTFCRLSEANPSTDPEQPRHRLPLARSGIPLARSSPSPVYKISKTSNSQAQSSQSTCSFQSAKSTTFDLNHSNHEVKLGPCPLVMAKEFNSFIEGGQRIYVHGGGDFQKEPKLSPCSLASAVKSINSTEVISIEHEFEKRQLQNSRESRIRGEEISRRSPTILKSSFPLISNCREKIIESDMFTLSAPSVTKSDEDKMLKTPSIDKLIYTGSAALTEKENLRQNTEDRHIMSLKPVRLMETESCLKKNETVDRMHFPKSKESINREVSQPDNDKKDIDFDMIDTLLKRVGYFEQQLRKSREETKLKIQQMSEQRNYFLKKLEHIIKNIVQNVIENNESITKNFKALEKDLEDRENEIQQLQLKIKRLIAQQKYNIEPKNKEYEDLVQIHNRETAILKDENMTLRAELEKQKILNRLNLNIEDDIIIDVQLSSRRNKSSQNNNIDSTKDKLDLPELNDNRKSESKKMSSLTKTESMETIRSDIPSSSLRESCEVHKSEKQINMGSPSRTFVSNMKHQVEFLDNFKENLKRCSEMVGRIKHNLESKK